MKKGSPNYMPAVCIATLINVLIALTLILPTSTIASKNEGDALKRFIASADPEGKVAKQWNGEDPCNKVEWLGVYCSAAGNVTSLILDGMNLIGLIPEGSLGQLTELRILSLNRNGITGPIPSDLTNCANLKQLYMMNNQLSGPIPSPLSHRLRRISLANNKLSESIPSSLADIDGLLSLFLENNMLTGAIPALYQQSLVEFNVSFNNLSGPIPSAISSRAFLTASSFMGNADLCGIPRESCKSSSHLDVGASPPGTNGQPASQKASKKHLTTGQIVAIVIADIAFLLLLTLCFLYYYKKRYTGKRPINNMMKASTKVVPSERQDFQSSPVSMADEDKPKLVFFEDQHTFRLEDLLRASAELLGKGSLGSAYKAVMEDGRAVCVKRLKELSNVARKEFEQQMQLVGKLRHPNVVPLWAYYYAKEEKLLVYQYQPNGNLLTLLRAGQSRASGGKAATKPVPWNARLRIARGVAKGLAFLHHECESQNIPHGNIKASNILIDKDFEARIADFGLAPLLRPDKAALSATPPMVGYQAPEYNNSHRKVTHKADVYSFGVLLLELLTGRITDYNDSICESPQAAFNLPQWVRSVVREEWTGEVFDRTLIASNASEESLVTMLQIAMGCISKSPDQRPRMSQVHKMIARIREDEYNASTSTSMSLELSQVGTHDQSTSSDYSAMMNSRAPFYEDEDRSFGF